MRFLRPSHALAAMLPLLASCRDHQIKTYTVPKERPEPAVSVANMSPDRMANAPVDTAHGAALTWTAPSHWVPKEGSAMRKATYAISGQGGAEAELTVTAFPGDVGGDLANINRWRGQLQLPPLAAGELESATRHLDIGELHVTTVEIVGADNTQRLLGAIVPFDGATWFFKLTGPDTLVANERAAFDTFIRTLRPATLREASP